MEDRPRDGAETIAPADGAATTEASIQPPGTLGAPAVLDAAAATA